MITPIPPIWINNRMTSCPNDDQYAAVSCTTQPITQTAETEVNKASKNGVTMLRGLKKAASA